MAAAGKLIEAVVDAGLELALPCGIPTHEHSVTKRWSRLDQVFISDHSGTILILCDTQTDMRGINTDHLPIRTELNLIAPPVEINQLPNFRGMDWEEFGNYLRNQLDKLPPPTLIRSQEQLDKCCEELTEVLQKAIQMKVPDIDHTSKSKRWWTKELTQL